MFLCIALCQSVAPSWGAGLPVQLINRVAPKISQFYVQEVHTVTLPSTCCYDDVGIKCVHLDLQQIAWSSISAPSI